jgi:hypothetical protein
MTNSVQRRILEGQRVNAQLGHEVNAVILGPGIYQGLVAELTETEKELGHEKIDPQPLRFCGLFVLTNKFLPPDMLRYTYV